MQECGAGGSAGDVMQDDEADRQKPNAVECGEVRGPSSPWFLGLLQNLVQSGRNLAVICRVVPEEAWRLTLK